MYVFVYIFFIENGMMCYNDILYSFSLCIPIPLHRGAMNGVFLDNWYRPAGRPQALGNDFYWEKSKKKNALKKSSLPSRGAASVVRWQAKDKIKYKGSSHQNYSILIALFNNIFWGIHQKFLGWYSSPRTPVSQGPGRLTVGISSTGSGLLWTPKMTNHADIGKKLYQ